MTSQGNYSRVAPASQTLYRIILVNQRHANAAIEMKRRVIAGMALLEEAALLEAGIEEMAAGFETEVEVGLEVRKKQCFH